MISQFFRNLTYMKKDYFNFQLFHANQEFWHKHRIPTYMWGYIIE